MPQLLPEHKGSDAGVVGVCAGFFLVNARSWWRSQLYSSALDGLPSQARYFESEMAKLIVISGEERQEFDLAAFNTIGRHPDNTIQIAGSSASSVRVAAMWRPTRHRWNKPP